MRQLSKHFYTDWTFYKKLLAITIPIALQNVISLGVTMMDTIMLGQLGDVAIAASNLGGQLFTILDVLGFGFASGAAVLISQYWGKKDIDRIRQIFALTLRVVLVVSILFSLVGFFASKQVLRIFATDAAVIAAGASYLRLLSLSFVLFSFSNCYIMCLRAVEQVRISMVIYGSSFFINVFFNYCFIFGKLGAPAMGVQGAALGTLMARLFEFIATLLYMCFAEKRVCFTPRWLLKLKSGLAWDYIRNSLPVVSNELLWGVGMSIINLTIGHMGPSYTSAMSIVNVFNQLVSVFIFGMSAATAVVVGKTIGEGRISDARRTANSSLVLGFCMSLVGMVLLLIGQPYILGLYNVSLEAHNAAVAMMTILALMQPFQAISCVVTLGVLRGGGDVRTNLILDGGLLWCVSIPLGLISAFVLHLSAPVVFFCMRLDNVIKSIAGLIRLRSGKWIKIVTRDNS